MSTEHRTTNNVSDNKLCTGCGACFNVCQEDAIVMIFDEDGYLKPNINESCINCGICAERCPTLHPVYNNSSTPRSYALWMPEDIRSKSTSGGAFSLFALDVLKKNGVVFGAAWTDDFYLKIVEIDNSKNLERLRHSKYVQSDASESYEKVKELLEKGTLVLYSACPCQVAGLNSYLNKEYSNLITIDILCGNVPSIKMFHKYLLEFADISDIDNIVFRDGSLGSDPHNHRITYKDGKSELKSKWTGDPYQKAYHSPNLMANEICRYCLFAKIPRQGDITIGDFWGIDKIDSSWDDKKGTSVVLVNSTKGELLLKDLTKGAERLQEIPIEKTLSTPNRFSNDGHYGPREQRNFFTRRLKNSGSLFSDTVSKALHETYDVGIVTALSHNYGGNLTYYALFEYLKELDKTILMIDRRKDCLAPPHSNPFHTFEKIPYGKWEICNDIKNKKELREMNDRCDIFLLGSDQMLHPNFIVKFGEHTCLNWVYSYKPKISYAASYGKDTFEGNDEFKLVVGEMLKRFDRFSVREKSAVELSKREFGVDAVQVLDPVFLLDSKKYIEFSNNGKIKFPERYIGAYILDPNEHKSKLLEEISNIEDLSISLIKDTYADSKRYSNYNLTPLENVKVEDWINNVYNCEIFITDSFHGACFAIILKKPFIILDNPLRGSTRISSLIEMFGLQSVLVEGSEYDFNKLLKASKTLDYVKIHKKLDSEIKRSKKWLNEALECKEKKKVFDGFDKRWNEEIELESSIAPKANRVAETKDAKDSFKIILEQAERGNSSAQKKIATMYRKGTGTEKKLDYAIEWIKKAVENREYESYNELIDCLLERGNNEDLEEAFDVALNYATNGFPGVNIRLARMYRDGKGVKKDLNKAIEWMQIACKNEEQWSWNELIDLLKISSDRDLKMAYEVALDYAERGDPGANVRLARMYYHGRGTEKDHDMAIEIMRIAANKGNKYGKNELVDYLLERDKEEDLVEAKIVASELAKTGDGRAQIKCEGDKHI